MQAPPHVRVSIAELPHRYGTVGAIESPPSCCVMYEIVYSRHWKRIGRANNAVGEVASRQRKVQRTREGL